MGKAYNVTAFCDNDISKQGQLVCDIPVISAEKLYEMNHEELMVIVCSINKEAEIKQQLLEHKIHNFVSVFQIDFGGGEEYYDEEYFAYQRKIGEFGGKVKAGIFLPYIKEDMVVVEFGSGGGYLLDRINCKEKVGIEINDTAREMAKQIGINSVKYVDDIPNEYADIIISTSTLEHVEHLLKILRELKDKLKEDGMIVFQVPNESCDTEYTKSEINNHLYTWNCLTLGNLFKAAGYFVHSVEMYEEVWPKHFWEIEKEVSPQFFDAICNIAGHAFAEKRCLIVASK